VGAAPVAELPMSRRSTSPTLIAPLRTPHPSRSLGRRMMRRLLRSRSTSCPPRALGRLGRPRLLCRATATRTRSRLLPRTTLGRATPRASPFRAEANRSGTPVLRVPPQSLRSAGVVATPRRYDARASASRPSRTSATRARRRDGRVAGGLRAAGSGARGRRPQRARSSGSTSPPA